MMGKCDLQSRVKIATKAVAKRFSSPNFNQYQLIFEKSYQLQPVAESVANSVPAQITVFQCLTDVKSEKLCFSFADIIVRISLQKVIRSSHC